MRPSSDGNLIGWLRSRRLGRLQLVGLASASGFATAMIIVAATSPTSTQSAVLAALQHRRVLVHTVDAPAAPSRAGGGGSSAAAGGSTAATDTSTGTTSSVAPTSSSAPTSATTTTATNTSSAISTNASTTSTTAAPAVAGPTSESYEVKHVFVIALSTTSYHATFGRGSVAHYLNGALVPRGTLLTDYRTLARAELPDYLAMISGQAPNRDTREGCPTYAEFPQGATPNAAGLVHGPGCVYPNTVLTIGDQVTSSGHTWKAYIADMGSSTCLHPNAGADDHARLPFAGQQYDTGHNPFIYFHSLLDLGDCSSDDESLDQLAGDLRVRSRTPSYAFIAPGGCDDATQTTCPDGKRGGLAGEDAFLRLWVPRILRAPAYRQSGALIIVFTHAGAATGGHANMPVRAGALVLSQYALAHHSLAGDYNPYSLLRSIEDLLGFTPLGHAQGAPSFASASLPGAVDK